MRYNRERPGSRGWKKLLKHQQKYQNPTQERERKKKRARRVSTEGYETGVTKTCHWKLQPDNLILGLVFLFWFVKLNKKGLSSH